MPFETQELLFEKYLLKIYHFTHVKNKYKTLEDKSKE